MPFINRLFAKINGQGTASQTALPPTTDRFNDFSDDEDDGDRNFKHRRQRSESQEEQDRSTKRRIVDDTNSQNKFYRERPNPNNIPVTHPGSFNGHFDNNRGRGRGGRMHNMNRPRPQCRDYNGMLQADIRFLLLILFPKQKKVSV